MKTEKKTEQHERNESKRHIEQRRQQQADKGVKRFLENIRSQKDKGRINQKRSNSMEKAEQHERNESEQRIEQRRQQRADNRVKRFIEKKRRQKVEKGEINQMRSNEEVMFKKSRREEIVKKGINEMAPRDEVMFKKLEPHIDNKNKAQIVAERIVGTDVRETIVGRELKKRFPKEKGYEIAAQKTLYKYDEKDGKYKEAKDNKGKGRRIDFIVLKEGKITHAFEVTSEKATKKAQMAGEKEIRDSGRICIKHKGKEIEYPKHVENQIVRIG